MKNLELTQVDQLLEILQQKPAQRIVHFCESHTNISDSLHIFAQTNDRR